MKILLGMSNVLNGDFIQKISLSKNIESRQQRQKRIKDERKKQLIDSFNSVGVGYHRQQGWF